MAAIDDGNGILFESVRIYITEHEVSGTIPKNDYINHLLWEGNLYMPCVKDPSSSDCDIIFGYDRLPLYYGAVNTSSYYSQIRAANCVPGFARTSFDDLLVSGFGSNGGNGVYSIVFTEIRGRSSDATAALAALDNVTVIVSFPEHTNCYVYRRNKSSLDYTTMSGANWGVMERNGNITVYNTVVWMPRMLAAGQPWVNLWSCWPIGNVRLTTEGVRWVAGVYDYYMEIYSNVQALITVDNYTSARLYPFYHYRNIESEQWSQIQAYTTAFINQWLNPEAPDRSYDCFIQGFRVGQIMGKPGLFRESAPPLPASGGGIAYDDGSFLQGLICGYHSRGRY